MSPFSHKVLIVALINLSCLHTQLLLSLLLLTLLDATCTLTNVQAFAVDLVGPAGVVAQSFDAAVQVDEERLQEGLPSVQSLQRLMNP